MATTTKRKKKCNTTITVAINDKDKDTLQKAADRDSRKLSDWIRMVALQRASEVSRGS